MNKVEIRKMKKYFEKEKDEEERIRLTEEYFKPSLEEKNKNAEVSTPFWLVNEMLNILDIDYYENFILENRKVLDPCVGKGAFSYSIYLKLMKHAIIYDEEKEPLEDEKERKKIILKHLYMIDINKTNIFIVKFILDPYDEFELNIIEGNTLQIDTKKEFGVEKFDLIIGNPPYNEEFNINGAGARPLYHKFIEKFIDSCDKLLFVVPSRWFSGGKGLNFFRQSMLKRKDIKLIKNYLNSKDVFKNVDIKGGVNYFLKDKNHNGECNFIQNNEINFIDLDKYDILVEPKFYKLIDYAIQLCKKHGKLTSLYKSQDYFNIQSNDKRFENKSNENNIKCYVSKQKGFEKWIDKKFIDKDKIKLMESWKVLTTSASHKGRSGFGNIFISMPSEVYCKSYNGFFVKNKKEALSLESYMRSKFVNLLLSLRKITQSLSENTLFWIPLISLNKIWTNDEINKYFNLNKKLIKLINESFVIGYKNIELNN